VSHCGTGVVAAQTGGVAFGEVVDELVVKIIET
jgi:hypothetical protein